MSKYPFRVTRESPKIYQILSRYVDLIQRLISDTGRAKAWLASVSDLSWCTVILTSHVVNNTQAEQPHRLTEVARGRVEPCWLVNVGGTIISRARKVAWFCNVDALNPYDLARTIPIRPIRQRSAGLQRLRRSEEAQSLRAPRAVCVVSVHCSNWLNREKLPP